ncbi:MAG: Aerobic C4-dicarboxylate transport protein [Nitrospirae bacterium]|nr:MAG: putative c4-dicarboxylate transport protein [Nitrospira sp. OLB3]MBV6470347.1 Aerobic C4-dicarboxylate transport protein [Nitrospirota bacterium]MCE7964377.1 dicarboxylate/amino acid:cation symporter [Nitrospira sp. NTP2]MCK6493373.1 dicarboxylate/amino acid:cation symporter [Nitrospira sp.]MEB2337383.1 dicarboxylate/amino acid:cation symporter [Nitrospirales bacterium]
MKSTPSLIPLPLYTQVLIAVLCGGLLGVLFGQEPYLGGLRNAQLGKLGLFVVTLLKTLAIPLIFFAILDALIRTTIPLRQGGKLLVICLVNVTVAMAIGLFIMNTWQPGLSWYGHVDELLHFVPGTTPSASVLANVQAGSESPIEYLASYIPRTITDPFSSNNIIGVVLLALALGTTLRLVRSRTNQTTGFVNALVRIIERIYEWLVWILEWIIVVVPLAVFGVVAQVVGKAGIGVFSVLWIFLVAMLAGLAVHALIYYPLLAWVAGKKSPKVYLGQGADAILTAVSCNSSLATVPVTLQCLHRMEVSPQSSRLAACVGTNLNNDGITLYEAMAALFLAQALGFDLPMVKQVLIVLASIIAGAGVAGIPEAGLIVLPLVLVAAGLPDQVIIAAIPLIMTVDWIIARARSGVNVMSDMLVAILLDAGHAAPKAKPVDLPTPSKAPRSREVQA